MSNEIRIAITIRLPEDAAQEAAHTQTVFTAWRAFTEAVKASNPMVNDFYLGPAKTVLVASGRRRLAPVPDSAA